MTSKFVALRSNEGKWMLFETKFDRQVGDAMVFDDIKYVVIVEGDKELCEAAIRTGIEHGKSKENQLVYPEGAFIERELIEQ